jgi:hypothetical protein
MGMGVAPIWSGCSANTKARANQAVMTALEFFVCRKISFAGKPRLTGTNPKIP